MRNEDARQQSVIGLIILAVLAVIMFAAGIIVPLPFAVGYFFGGASAFGITTAAMNIWGANSSVRSKEPSNVAVVKPITLQPGDTFVCCTAGEGYVKLVKLDGTEVELTEATQSTTDANRGSARELNPMTFMLAAHMAARMHGFVVSRTGFTTDRRTRDSLFTCPVERDGD